MDREIIELNGTVSAVIYQNESNGYTVLRLEVPEGGETIVVGCLPFVVSGERLTLTGNWMNHSVHGMQFKAGSVKRLLPETRKQIFDYLSSGVVKGVGTATARLIVSQFGEDALRVLSEEPEELSKIKNISVRRAKQIGNAFKQQNTLRMLMEFFSENGLDMKYAMRLYKLYGDNSQTMLRKNPYLLVDEYFGADFIEADRLALKLGFDAQSKERAGAALTFELMHNSRNGHCFIPEDKLIEVTARLISVQHETVQDALAALREKGSIICGQVYGITACYLSALYDAENYVAKRIKALAERSNFVSYDPDRLIAESENEMGIILAEAQREAVRTAAYSGIMALTGGPGTGKTTTVRTILRMFDKMGLKTALAAPTGRAAKRMGELCSREASTIHRLLETGYDAERGELVFMRCEDDPLLADAVILDETSMVDIVLMQALMCAMKPKCKLILVGDADQLPSVGPGNLFSDIIKSGIVETVYLNEVFRQAEQSLIIRNAHRINRGELPEISDKNADFFFLKRRDGEDAVTLIEELCAKRLPEKMGIDQSQIQVLSPTRMYSTGTQNLNKRLQNALNPPGIGKKEKTFGEFVFRVGDRVMQIRNNYDIIWKKTSGELGLGVFNGDVGRITELDTDEQLLIVEYDDKYVSYTFEMLSDLEPAYAMTVHKSQGSEYRAVILSLVKSAPNLLSRSILYTAVTRARELLIIVGDPEIVRMMVDNNKPRKRYTGLKAKLME